jgi:hypothetical protein
LGTATAFRITALAGLQLVTNVTGLMTGERLSSSQFLGQAEDLWRSLNFSMGSDKLCHQQGGNNVRKPHFGYCQML